MDEPVVPGYELLGELGRGASSVVWRGRRRADGVELALKVLTPAGGDVSAGLREAGLLARVRHQHVLHLYDVIPLPDSVTGRPAAVVLATQLAGGGTLAQVLSRRGMLSPGELVTVLHPVAAALSELHDQGVVHGDLSTGNVLFLLDGMPVLGDLGAARVVGSMGRDPMGTGGADGMVAPEVLEGFQPTPESDVYQMGSLAWRSLTGKPPGPVWDRTPLGEVAPELPPALVDLVTRCMAPQPEDRPDAEEVAVALLAVATPEPVEIAPDAEPEMFLTERLRQQAREDLAVEEPRRRWWERRGGAATSARSGAAARAAASGKAGETSARTGEPAGTHRPERVGVGGSGAVRRVEGALTWAAAVVALVLVAGAGYLIVSGVLGPPPSAAPATQVGAGNGSGQDGSQESIGQGVATDGRGGSADRAAEDEVAGHGAETSISDTAAGTTTSDSAAETSTSASAPELVSVVQRLVDGRAAAWEGADPGLLTGVMATDSPALASDEAHLNAIVEQQLQYRNVTFRVDDVRVRERTAERLDLSATISRAPLNAHSPSGEERLALPMRTDQVELVLTAGPEPGQWQLWSWGNR
ncbi:serine/threonine-protein kinase [Ornithinimicrobium sp. Y1847]|uniref:serine/threonine-protein kinase n=1 Tax=Ornithinimicrobium sp. Y1847 TaxID=3405419 RepID=UPI003B66B466